MLHMVALFLMGKNGVSIGILRPDDLTSILLLMVCAAILASGTAVVPATVTPIVAAYLGFFAAVLILQDVLAGYPQAVVFWVKEASYVAFGYLIWRSFRSRPRLFINIAIIMSLPNLAYGAYQLATVPRGIYGVSPFGHHDSPASSGMLFLTFSIVWFLKVLGGALWAWPVMLLTLGLVLTSGSKAAVLGAITFYAFYLFESVRRKGGLRALMWLGGFAAVSVGGLAAATAAGFALRGPWRGMARYHGFLNPIEELATRGIWWKVQWIESPMEALIGAGYSPGHLTPTGYGYGMSMDNQLLYYGITGGIIGLVLYAVLLIAVFRAIAPESKERAIARAAVVCFAFMGLGAEVLQLSVPGNLFWMIVGVSLALAWHRRAATAGPVVAT